jgi:putative two-component system response regulator
MNDPQCVLVVEDDPSMLGMIRSLLETEGPYTVVAARSIAEAQLAIERYNPGLVVSDRFLDQEDGLALCQWVKEHPQHRDTMFVLLTGAHSAQEKIDGFHAGADDYITKPFHAQELLSRVRVMLRIRCMQEELCKDRNELKRLNAALSSHLGAVEKLLVNIIGLRVPDASARAEMAARFSRWIGERLEFEPDALQELTLAARLHEIGKVILTDDIIAQEQAKRSAEYRITMQQSPVFGQMIVGNIPELRNVGLIIRHQRENYDGTGHPGKLMHAEIPPSCRILRVVNYLEDMSDSADGRAVLIERLREASGTILDPAIVRLAEEYLVAVDDPTWMEGKRQVALKEMREGMVIAADLFTASGVKLLPSGSRLTPSNIERILSHHAADPIINRVFVYA